MELPDVGSMSASVRKDDAFIHPPVLTRVASGENDMGRKTQDVVEYLHMSDKARDRVSGDELHTQSIVREDVWLDYAVIAKYLVEESLAKTHLH